MAEDQKDRHIPGRGNVPIHDPKDGNGNSNGVTMGVAVTIVVSGLISGGVGSVAEVSAADASSVEARPSTSDEFSVETRPSRCRTEVRIAGDADSLRATFRLRRHGGNPTTLNAQSDKNCTDHSDGEVHAFFVAHPCISLYRTLIGYTDGDYVIRFLIATIEMPDDSTATDLHSLLSSDHTGDITPLSPKDGKYVPFTLGLSTTTLQDTVVTNTRTQAVGRTPRAEALGFLTTSLLLGLG